MAIQDAPGSRLLQGVSTPESSSSAFEAAAATGEGPGGLWGVKKDVTVRCCCSGGYWGVRAAEEDSVEVPPLLLTLHV